MPETLRVVERALATLSSLGVQPVTLLVVPGRDWSAPDLTRLRAIAAQGHELAAHGWRHQAERIGGLYHRLHALFLSRTVAEHLALDADGILALLKRSQDWFIQQGFAPPTLYVPPAWAMGAISRARLSDEGPFARYEVFGGIYEATTQEWRPTPMLGYEADTPGRVLPLQLWNALNRQRARTAGVIRIGIHPHDLDYALAKDLKTDLQTFSRYGRYAGHSSRD
ncbi:polysaccharide deacetylase family protein [Thiorhodovibrio winogradskyi]